MVHIPAPTRASLREQTTRAVLRVVWITMALNIVNALLKLVAGVWSGNLTVISASVDGFLDALNNGIGIAALKASWRPPDANHPYGHRKYEALASLAIGGIMTLTGWEILKEVYTRWHRGYVASDMAAGTEPGNQMWIWLGIVFAGLVINLAITTYERRRGHALRSQFLIADAAHTAADVLVTGLAIISLLCARRWPWLDGILSLIVVGFIFRAGFGIIRENALLLTDAVQLDPEPIRRVVEAVQNVQNAHAIRTHGMPDEVHLDLHIVVAPDLSAHDAHVTELRVREALMQNFPEIREVAIHHQTHKPMEARPIALDH